MIAINAPVLLASRVSFAPVLAVLLLGGLPACGGGGDDGGSGGSSASGGSGGSSGGSGGSSASGGAGGSSSGSGGTTAGSSGSGGTNGNAEPSGEVCPNPERAGTLSLRLSGGDRTIFDGAISDGITPTSVYRQIAAEGGCQLLGPRDLFCSTDCASGSTCAGDDMCIPSPMNQSAGTLTVTGLLSPLEVTRNGITGGYSKTVLDPYPLFEPGAAVELSASGDVFSAFTLRGWGVSPLVTSLTTVNVTPGSSVPLTWDTTGVNAEQTEIFMSFSVNVHGATTGWIECTVPDTGSFEIPASLVSDLVDLGLSGFPRMYMARRSADSTQLSTGDCVDFQIISEVKIELTVDGLISCSEEMPCPEGQTCTPEAACE